MIHPFSSTLAMGQRPGIKTTVTSANLLSLYASTVLWYDFSNSGSAYSPLPITVVNGGSMTGANDLTTGNHDATTQTNMKYATNAAGTLSACNMVAGGYFNTPSTTTFLSNLAGMTVIVACKPSASAATMYLCNTDQGDLEIFYTNASYWSVKCSGGTGVSTVPYTNNVWQIHSFVFDGNGATNAQKLRYRYNKADQTLTITGTVATKSGASNDNYVWGAKDSSSSNPFKGFIGEVFIFNKALTVAEVAGIETYLGAKWGV